MVEYLRGRVVGAGASWIVLEAGGVGMRVRVHAPARFARLKGREVLLPVWLEFSPRRLALYGFLDAAERGRFETLVAIPGIGPATALKLLPAWDALSAQRASHVPVVPGVGPAKTARIAKWLARRGGIRPEDAAKRDPEVIRALRVLGLSAVEARERARKASARAPGASVEELVRLATSRKGG